MGVDSLDCAPLKAVEDLCYEEGLKGEHCELVPVNKEAHCDALFNLAKDDPGMYTYLPYGPMRKREDLEQVLSKAEEKDPTILWYTVLGKKGDEERTPVGFLTYLRICPEFSRLEIGHVNFSSAMRRSKLGTETIFLLIENAFRKGYDRVEWKCDSLNEKSILAALRYGFTYEGLWRNATVYKGRTRDTAWFSMLRSEWEAFLRQGFLDWLNAKNFDSDGSQIQSLQSFFPSKPYNKALPTMLRENCSFLINEFGQPIGQDVSISAKPFVSLNENLVHHCRGDAVTRQRLEELYSSLPGEFLKNNNPQLSSVPSGENLYIFLEPSSASIAGWCNLEQDLLVGSVALPHVVFLPSSEPSTILAVVKSIVESSQRLGFRRLMATVDELDGRTIHTFETTLKKLFKRESLFRCSERYNEDTHSIVCYGSTSLN